MQVGPDASSLPADAGSGESRYRRWVPILLLSILLIVGSILLLGVLFLVSRTEDRVARESSVVSVAAGLGSIEDAFGRITKDYARQEDAIRRLGPAETLEKTVSELAVRVARQFDVSTVILVDGENRTVYAATHGKRQDVDALAAIEGGLNILVANSRSAAADEPTAATGLVRFGDTIQIAAAAMVAGWTTDTSPTKAMPVLVFLRRMDPAFLEAFGRSRQIGDLRIVMPDAAASGSAGIRLISADGATLGVLAWSPMMPGHQLFVDLLPGLGAVLLLMAAMGWILVRRVQDTQERLQESAHLLAAKNLALAESETRFRDFAAAASDWLWEQDADFRYTFISPGVLSRYGSTEADFYGKRREETAPLGVSDPQWQGHMADLAAWRPFRNFSYCRLDAGGNKRWLTISGRPVFGAGGKFVGYRGVGRDVTAEVEAESRAAAARTQMIDAIESIPAGFALYNTEERLVLWNSQITKFQSNTASRNLVLGTKIGDILRAELTVGEIATARGQEENWLAERLAKFRNGGGMTEFQLADGRWMQVLDRKTQDGGTVSIRLDVTERRRAEETLMETKRALENQVEFLDTLIETMPNPIYYKDPEGRYLGCNRAFAAVLGVPKEKVIGKTVFDFFDKATAERYWAADRQLFDAPGEQSYEIDLRFGDGLLHDVIFNKATFALADGSTVGIAGVVVDITERKRAEAALRQSENRYRRLVELSPDGIMIVSGGRILFVNSAGAQLLGAASADRLIGASILNFLEADNERAVIEQIADLLDRGGEIAPVEIKLRRQNNRLIDIELAANPFGEAESRSIQLVMRDVSERKIAQNQIMQTSKLATLGEVAAGMAHELNQPLNIIRMAADSCLILREEGAIDAVFEGQQLALISDQTKRMAQIIDHMRVFSRRDAGNSEPFDPAECVFGAVHLVRDQFRMDDIDLVVRLPDSSRPVRGHRIRMEQALLNLLANARDALFERVAGGIGSPAGLRVEVEMIDDPRESTVLIAVADNGKGLPPEILERLFEPFFTTKEAGKGTGLGLSIAYSIVTGMGGLITASNLPAGGARFEIRLPCVASGVIAEASPQRRAGDG
ncbi:MAG: PAS domain S-box protein, partial [Rhodospirillales bacterium]|nr:PAS domain S-box protein [Rhodospirillales bacterium]